jgi:uncharacterized protein YaiE (UPF0345 family)
MKTTISTSQAADILFNDKSAGWSYAGARALVEYLEELEEGTGEEMEFDCVAIRCDFSEHSDLKDWLTSYYGEHFDVAMKSAGIDLDGDEDDEEIDDWIRSHIQDHGQLIEFEGGIIVSSF